MENIFYLLKNWLTFAIYREEVLYFQMPDARQFLSDMTLFNIEKIVFINAKMNDYTDI